MVVVEIYNDTYYVYAHINKINGKMYVGQTSQRPTKRWNHGHGYKGCDYFYYAIQKYGWDNFDHEIIASNLTKNEADNFEKLLIDRLNLLDPTYGYNLREGGSHWKMTEEHKQKIKEANSGENHPFYGKHLSDEHKANISKATSGENNNFYGKHHSIESKNKISLANRGAKHYNSKRVYQYDIYGNFIKEWDNISRVAEAYEVGRTTAMNYCRSGKIFKDEFILKLEKEED